MAGVDRDGRINETRNAMSDKIKEEIAFYRDVFKTAVFLMVTTAGGTVSLLFKLNSSPLVLFLVFAGLFLEPLWIMWAIFSYRRVKKLLEEL